LFLERRKRGLTRFINLLVKHPILSSEKLVSIFLTVDTELTSWRSGTSLELEEEFTHKIISQQFIKNWKEEQEMNRWRSIRLGTETALETLTYVIQLIFFFHFFVFFSINIIFLGNYAR
jgi:sorting nexin-8